jgi:serine/threonine protein kinase
MNDGRDLTGTVVANQFHLDERLDAGGMGAVYRVTELTTRRARALKLLHAEVALNPKAVALFEREVRIGSAIGFSGAFAVTHLAAVV